MVDYRLTFGRTFFLFPFLNLFNLSVLQKKQVISKNIHHILFLQFLQICVYSACRTFFLSVDSFQC